LIRDRLLIGERLLIRDRSPILHGAPIRHRGSQIVQNQHCQSSCFNGFANSQKELV